MIKICLLILLSILSTVSIASAVDDTWELAAHEEILVGQTFTANNHTITIYDQQKLYPDNFLLILKITYDGKTRFQMIHPGEMILLDDNHTQLLFVRTDVEKHIINVWFERAPQLSVASTISKPSKRAYEANITVSTDNVSVTDFNASLILPEGFSSSTKTVFDHVPIAASSSITKSVRLSFTEEPEDDEMTLQMMYRYKNGTKTGMKEAIITIPDIPDPDTSSSSSKSSSSSSSSKNRVISAKNRVTASNVSSTTVSSVVNHTTAITPDVVVSTDQVNSLVSGVGNLTGNTSNVSSDVLEPNGTIPPAQNPIQQAVQQNPVSTTTPKTSSSSGGSEFMLIGAGLIVAIIFIYSMM